MRLRALLRTPGVAGPFASSLVARLPMTALGLLLVLHVRGLGGSFAAAGLAAAGYAIGLGVSSPLLGRLVDRRGQAPVLARCGAAVSLALLAIAVLPAGAPVAAVVALAVAAGLAMPPLGACLRALWIEHVPDPGARHAAFALDSAAVELLYALGPVVLAGGVGSWSTRGALATAAACSAGGTAVYVTRPAARAWRSRHVPAAGRAGALASPAVRTLLGVLLLLGSAFGAIEIGVASAASAAHHPSASGLLFAAWGLGSMSGALLVARRAAPADPVRRLLALLGCFALAHGLLLVTTEPLLLAPLLLVAGASIAPTLTTIMSLIGDVAPPGAVTEAFTWTSSAITGGLAAGAALGGALAEQRPGAPFLLAVAAGVAAMALAALSRPSLAAVRARS